MGEEYSDYLTNIGCDGEDKEKMALGRDEGWREVFIFLRFFPLRCERQCLNADGKEPAEGEGADPVERGGTADGAESLRKGGSGAPAGSGVTGAGTDSWEGPILPITPGSSGLWRFYVTIKKVTHDL